ncbi:MAG: polysaccharide biosynthesis protein [Paludibacteraceae bacterium]|nr:polysaccharide biosynthesis protein [Paludibacteraceae bacterium]
MFNLTQFISTYVTHRQVSMFAADIEANKPEIEKQVCNKRVCVIGGAGSIGSSFIKALLPFHPKQLIVVDLNENGLAELTRDLRSSANIQVPEDYRTYTLDFASPIFERIFHEEKGFDIVANFSAHKHVRSERDRYSVQALIENNDIKAKKLMDMMLVYKPAHFFCVSTDKAANPVNIMGASKRILEDLIMAYSAEYNVTTARFANVAFSNGSLPDGWLHRLQKRQPLAAPNDVKRYFVSPEESGQICLLACILGKSGEVFFPKLGEEQMLKFSDICDDFIREQGLQKHLCATDEEAKQCAASLYSQPQSQSQPQPYPVIYTGSNTTGEKAYEEFYVQGEKINTTRFQSLGVVEQSQRHSMLEVNQLFRQFESIFARPDFTKAEVVDAIKSFIPTFEHEEKGKNLDSKM